jgi:hypothetical protein
VNFNARRQALSNYDFIIKWLRTDENIKDSSLSGQLRRANALSYINRYERQKRIVDKYCKYRVDDYHPKQIRLSYSNYQSWRYTIIDEDIDGIDIFNMICGAHRHLLFRYAINPDQCLQFEIKSHPSKKIWINFKEILKKSLNNGEAVIRMTLQNIYPGVCQLDNCRGGNNDDDNDDVIRSPLERHKRTVASRMFTSRIKESIIVTYLFKKNRCPPHWQHIAMELLDGPFGNDIIEYAIDKYYNGGVFTIDDSDHIPELPDSLLRNLPNCLSLKFELLAVDCPISAEESDDDTDNTIVKNEIDDL